MTARFEPLKWVPTVNVPPCPHNPCADSDSCKERVLLLSMLLRLKSSRCCTQAYIRTRANIDLRGITLDFLPEAAHPGCLIDAISTIIRLNGSSPSVFMTQLSLAVFCRPGSFALGVFAIFPAVPSVCSRHGEYCPDCALSTP